MRIWHNTSNPQPCPQPHLLEQLYLYICVCVYVTVCYVYACYVLCFVRTYRSLI